MGPRDEDRPPVNPESIHVQSGTVAQEAQELNEDTEVLANMTQADVREAVGVAADVAQIKAKTEQETATRKAVALVSADVLEAQRQNRINMLWEYTQAFLAIALVVAAIFASLFQDAVPDTLTNALFVVIGFYFGRTNHSRPTPANPRGDP